MRLPALRHFCFSVLLSLVCCAAAAGEPASESPLTADQLALRQQFIADIRLARRGETAAQLRVGQTYLQLGDLVAAKTWLLRAADAGECRAATTLGWMYEKGFGVARSDDDALRWYRRAARGDDALAQANLGRLLLMLQGDEALPEAREMFERSAVRGEAAGQYNLGLLFFDRASTLRDERGACAWFLKAAQQGHPGGQIALALCLTHGAGVEQDMEAARGWLAEATVSGDPVGNFYHGRLLAQGEGGPVDQVKALAAYRVAAAAGHREAQLAVAQMLAAGDEMARREALDWYRLAAESGHRTAMNRLGELHRDGVDAGRDEVLARKYFLRAAELGDPRAMYNAAVMVDEGRGGLRDQGDSLRLFALAADAGDVEAARLIERLLGTASSGTMSGVVGANEVSRGFWQR